MVSGAVLPARFLTKRDVVAEAIRRDILNGTLPPGSQLQQDEVAIRLGVSATPVREAFGALQAEGFLENVPHRGVFVANPNANDLIDIYELRALTEGLAIRRAAEADQKLSIRRLARVVQQGEQELKSENAERIRRSNNSFHRALIDLAQSQTITEINAHLMARSLFFPPFDLEYMKLVQTEHSAIVEAGRQGEIDHAVHLLTEHFRRHAERLRKLTGQQDATQPTSLVVE